MSEMRRLPDELKINDTHWNACEIRQIAASLLVSFDAISLRKGYGTTKSIVAVANLVRDRMARTFGGDAIIRGGRTSQWEISVTETGATSPCAFCIFEVHESDIWKERRHHIDFTLWGDEPRIKKLTEEFDEVFGKEAYATVKWWYQSPKEGPTYTNMVMEPPPPFYDSLYPWFPGKIAEYLDRYMNDRAPLLFLRGPAGTGKTSLLRHLVAEYSLAVTISYEDGLIRHDPMFIEFLTDSSDGVLIMEDAEALVESRQSGNTMMARFLNVSDGIIRPASRKKIIFTTNQNDFQGVDEALVRPGRCFGALTSRKLTYEEACVAADEIGIARPKTKDDISVGELFNPDAGTPIEQRKFGII